MSGERIFAALLRIDDQLAARGIPPLSPRWRDELRAFYTSGATVHAGRIGRGAAKSTNAAKCLVAEVLAGDWKVPPGERHWAINISENLAEATARLGQIGAYLDALGVPYERTGEQLLLAGRPLGFWSRPARIGALSGPRVVAWSVDEAAKLNVEGTNPAGELVASPKAASITHPGARGRVYSSPFGTVGYHFELVERGSDPSTFVSVGPTWVYNPSISEARTRQLEPDERIWAREYAAIPSASASAVFDVEQIEGAFRAPEGPNEAEGAGLPFLVIDSSAGRGDAWAWCVGQRIVEAIDSNPWVIAPSGTHDLRDERGNLIPNPRYSQGRASVYVTSLAAMEGRFALTTSADAVLDQVARTAHANGCRLVFGDQYGAYLLEAGFARRGLRYVALPWTNESKASAVSQLRRWFRERSIVLDVDDDQGAALRRELLAFEERLLPSGLSSYGARRGGHDDRVALLLNLAIADAAGLLHGSPLRVPSTRVDHSPNSIGPLTAGAPIGRDFAA